MKCLALLELLRIEIAGLVKNAISIPLRNFQMAGAEHAPVQRQGEEPPHHLCALHMVTVIHRQLCLCQSLKVINF